MDKEGQVVCPQYYSQVATEISELNMVIGHGLSHRPHPDGIPWEIPGQVSQLLEEMLDLIDALCRGFESFAACILAADADPTDAEIRQAFQRVASPVRRLLQVHHTLWQRPFPTGLEPGQVLLAEIMQRPLRDVLAMFERMLAVIDDPASALDADGSLTIRFHLHLEADREVKAFTRWCRNVREAGARPRGRPSLERSCPRPAGRHQDTSLVKVVMAFLFGWWWGKQ